MSIMIDLPPAMAREAQDYATVQGTTLERMLFDYLKRELNRRHDSRSNRLSEFIGCIGNGKRTDEVVGELRGYKNIGDCPRLFGSGDSIRPLRRIFWYNTT